MRVVKDRSSKAQPIRKVEQVQARDDGSIRLAVVSDTHSDPHDRAVDVIAQLHPDAVLHAGDIGELRVLDKLATVCPVMAVRGNIDVRLPGLADEMIVEVVSREGLILRILMLHIGIYGSKLRAEVARLAREEAASVVVCGHSHVPFIGREREITVFNPGSIGPRRFSLPIVFGMIEINESELRLSHIDCETGRPWAPPRLRA